MYSFNNTPIICVGISLAVYQLFIVLVHVILRNLNLQIIGIIAVILQKKIQTADTLWRRGILFHQYLMKITGM